MKKGSVAMVNLTNNANGKERISQSDQHTNDEERISHSDQHTNNEERISHSGQLN
jgi:hypothetical protein